MNVKKRTTRRNVIKAAIGTTAVGVMARHTSVAAASDLLGCDASVLDYPSVNNDIAERINSATASGCLHIYIPPGDYDQKTALTTNQEVHLYTTNYSFYGFNPVTITKDSGMGNTPHIDTNEPFSSLGINWDGADVGSDSDGFVLRNSFEVIGNVENQTGNGLVIAQQSDLDGPSVLAGACGSNGGAGVIINNTMKGLYVPYLRCNSNTKYGVRIRGLQYGCFENLRCDRNAVYGVYFDGDNPIKNNRFTIYAEYNPLPGSGGTEATNVYVNDDPLALAQFTDNMFFNPRGFDLADLYPQQGNVWYEGRNSQGILLNDQQTYVMAVVSTDQTNATGAGTNVIVAFDEAVHDTHGDYNATTGTFTAPGTGTYYVEGNIAVGNLSASHTRARMKLVTTQRTCYWEGDTSKIRSSSNIAVLPIPGGMIDMAANDTLHIELKIENGTNSVTLLGSPGAGQSYVTIRLMN